MAVRIASTLYQLDSELLGEAKKYLTTKSTLVGPDYLKSPVKRRLDLALATTFSFSAVPTIAVLGSAIFLSDRHNPFVDAGSINPLTNEHVPLWKLRTMIPDAQLLEIETTRDTDLNSVKKQGDPRVTRLGGILRKSSLDESPQIFLALTGQMSLVGPRMLSISEVRNQFKPNVFLPIHDDYLEYMRLLARGMKFGVTGFYVIFGRTELTLDQRIALDVIYGKNASLQGDLRILAATIPAVLSGKGAH